MNCIILDHLKGNVEFAYRFDLYFLSIGFFVNLFYGFMIASFITLITGLIRKFHWWSLVPFFALWLSLWIMKNPESTVGWANFYLKNSSPAIFFLKAILTLIVTEGLNLTINRHTNQCKALRFKSRYSILAIILSTIFCLNIFIGYCKVSSEDFAQNKPWQPLQNIDTSKNKPVCEVDAGKLPVDSELKVNINYQLISNYSINFGGGELNSTNDMIDIYYYPQQEMDTSVNLTAFTNPHIEASLTDNVLNILVTGDKNIKVVSLYPYSTLMQFDCFKNKPYAKQYLGGTYGTMPGTILVSLPENKNFHTSGSQ